MPNKLPQTPSPPHHLKVEENGLEMNVTGLGDVSHCHVEENGRRNWCDGLQADGSGPII
jgi:hypothetical protein